jgi:P27 family predicted phage terminase small subunit
MPTGVKLARGETRPSWVNYLEPTPRRAAPVMPDDMDAGAKVVWRRVVAEMASTEIILASDTDILRCYCEAVSQYQVAMRMLAASSPLVRSRGDLVKNPLHQIVRESRDAVRLFARELGLSPSARAGLDVRIDGTGGDMAAEIGPPPRLRVVGGADAGPR